MCVIQFLGRGYRSWYSDSLGARGFGLRIPMEMRNFLFSTSVRTDPGDELASCTVSLQVLFAGGKRPASPLAPTLRISKFTPPLPLRVCMSRCGLNPTFFTSSVQFSQRTAITSLCSFQQLVFSKRSTHSSLRGTNRIFIYAV